MSFVLELPTELASLVVELCDNKTLLAFCLASKACQAIAQKALYRQVDLRTLTDCILCFRTLLARPDLAGAIRDLLVMFESKDRLFSVFWSTLARILTLTPNLLSLHFAMQGPSAIVFRDCTLPRLRILSSVLDLSPELHAFLSRHPSIRQLCIGGETKNQRLHLPPSALPVLDTYLGSRSLARDIVPGRPIKHITLAWTSCIPQYEIADVIRTLAQGSVPMRHFGCTTFGGDANGGIMCAVAEYMPSLHSLRINNVSTGRPADEKFLFTIGAVVRSFKELRRLDIPYLANANDDQDAYDTVQEAAEAKKVVEWGTSCPSLKTITMPSCMTWHFVQEWGVWRRGTDEEAVTGGALL